MKSLVFFFFYVSALMAYEYKVQLGLEGVAYSKYTDEIAASGNAAFRFENELFKTNADITFLYSNEYKQRRYLLLNELFFSKDFNDYSFSIGKKIKYWGELEGYNIADVYNQKNYLKDPFDKSAKYGALGADLTRYFDENYLQFGVKFYEQNLPYPHGRTPYAPFTLNYDKELRLAHRRTTPTFYLVADFVTDESVDSETKLILLRGYDNKRYFISTSSSSLAQYAYSVSKVMLLSHILYKDMIFKSELSYTDVIKDTKMSDYRQLSFGTEKSFYEIFGSDVTLYGEYYRYFYNDNKKIKNVDISEIYDNDIFLAFRAVFNDVRSSELKAGILEDLQKNERVLKVKANSRVFESFVLYTEYLQIISHTSNTLLSRFGDSLRLSVGINYTF